MYGVADLTIQQFDHLTCFLCSLCLRARMIGPRGAWVLDNKIDFIIMSYVEFR